MLSACRLRCSAVARTSVMPVLRRTSHAPLMLHGAVRAAADGAANAAPLLAPATHDFGRVLVSSRGHGGFGDGGDKPVVADKGKEGEQGKDAGPGSAGTPAPPVTCVPDKALDFTDYTGTAPSGTGHAGKTTYDFNVVSGTGGDVIQAKFAGASSWLRSDVLNGGDRNANGCAGITTDCEASFTQEGDYYELDSRPVPGCAASERYPAGTKAMKKSECRSKVEPVCMTTKKKEAARVLHHEQRHLDLGCALAAMGTAAIAAGSSSSAALDQVKYTDGVLTAKYDSEAKNGCDATAQTKWDTEIGGGLPSYKLMTRPKKKK